MCVQLAGLRESSLTNVAYVRPNTAVYSLVPAQNGRLRKGLVTLVTSVRSFAGVNAYVSDDLARVAERLVADVARVRFVAAVNSLVHCQNCYVGKRFAADVAQALATVARRIIGVHAFVFNEVAGKTKRLVTYVAGVGFVVSVG